MDKYPKIKVIRKTGKEKFKLNGKPLNYDLLSFWQWSSSDLISNAMRGILAEYIVATAVGKTDKIRTEWDAFDIETDEGIKIEVKSGGIYPKLVSKEIITNQIWYSPNPRLGFQD